MHSAITATARPLPPPGKSLPKNRPAPFTTRAPRHPAAPNPHVTSQLQCYKHRSPSTNHESRFLRPGRFCGTRVTNHVFFNRQPARLEFATSPTKQTPAFQFNRQHFTTPRITIRGWVATGHESQFTNHESLLTTHASPATPNSLGPQRKPCYVCHAFVALVTPLDSMKGLQVHTCGLFCFTAGGGREANK